MTNVSVNRPYRRGARMLAPLLVFALASLALPARADDEVRSDPPDRFHDFYQQYLYWNGFYILSSDRPYDSALRAAKSRMQRMIGERPDIADAMREHDAYVAVMDRYEEVTDLPEYSHLETVDGRDPDDARGYGATVEIPLTAGAEENLLGWPWLYDPYEAEDIFVHEFAHSVLNLTMPQRFVDAVQTCLNEAEQKDLWRDTYARTDYEEYWAEAVQSYFGENVDFSGPNHNGINGEQELENYDSCIYELVDHTFSEEQVKRFSRWEASSWTYYEVYMTQWRSGRLRMAQGQDDVWYYVDVFEQNGRSWDHHRSGWQYGKHALNDRLAEMRFRDTYDVMVTVWGRSGESLELYPDSDDATAAGDRVRFEP